MSLKILKIYKKSEPQSKIYWFLYKKIVICF